jgi:hypothetical protein
MTFEDRITEALRAPLAQEAGTALDLRVRAAIAATPRLRGRRTWLTRGLVFAGLLAIAVPGAIVGGIFLTESPLGLAGAAEYAAEIEAAKAEVPLPLGRTWPDFLRPEDQDASYSRGGGRPTVEGVATCIWFDEWLDARAAVDASRQATAAATIAGIPSWESWNGPFFDQSYRDHFGPIIAAVGQGDATPVEAEMGMNCSWVRDE